MSFVNTTSSSYPTLFFSQKMSSEDSHEAIDVIESLGDIEADDDVVIYQRQVASIVGKGNVTLEKVKVLGDVVIGGKATIKDSIIRGLVTCRSTDLTIVGSQIDTLNITFDQGEPVLVLENSEVEAVMFEGTNAKVVCRGTSKVGQSVDLTASSSEL